MEFWVSAFIDNRRHHHHYREITLAQQVTHSHSPNSMKKTRLLYNRIRNDASVQLFCCDIKSNQKKKWGPKDLPFWQTIFFFFLLQTFELKKQFFFSKIYSKIMGRCRKKKQICQFKESIYHFSLFSWNSISIIFLQR